EGHAVWHGSAHAHAQTYAHGGKDHQQQRGLSQSVTKEIPYGGADSSQYRNFLFSLDRPHREKCSDDQGTNGIEEDLDHFQRHRFSLISRRGVKGFRQTHVGGVGCSSPRTEIQWLVIGVLERHNAAVVKVQSGNVLGGWSPGCGLACGDELPGRQWAVGDINVSEGRLAFCEADDG